jgi:Tfp pilus assembly PilM family ATPase/Tfp pilus assembly protein PilN
MFGIRVKRIGRLPNIGSRQLVGIDLSGNNLKLAQLNVSLNKTEIVNILNRSIIGLSDDDIVKMVREIFSGLNIKNPVVLDIIPSYAVITKNIEIPSTDRREIGEIIRLQAGRHTPYSREEIVVDYIEIGTYKNNYTKILLIILARNVAKRQYEILAKAGLKLEKVLLGAEGLACSAARIFKSENENFPVNIVHIDEGFTDFSVVFKNQLLFIRSIPIGAQHLLSEGEKYELKFIEELRRSLEVYQNEDIEKNPNLLILTGAIEELKSLEGALSNLMHLPIRSIPYLKNFSISEAAAKAASAARQLSFLNIVAPLFSWEKAKVDLMPEEIKLGKMLEERSRELIKTGIFVLTIFVLIFSVLLNKIYFKGVYLKKLDAKYQPLSQEAGKLEKDFTKISLIKDYLSRRGYSLEVLTELYNIITGDLRLSDVKFDDQDKFSIRGTADSMSTVFSFVEKMEKSKYFQEVRTRYTTKRKEGTRDVTDFEIVSVLKRSGG